MRRIAAGRLGITQAVMKGARSRESALPWVRDSPVPGKCTVSKKWSISNRFMWLGTWMEAKGRTEQRDEKHAAECRG